MAEREWREAIDLRSPKIGLLLVMTVAAVLRFWALPHGIPHNLGADEPAIMSVVMGMMRTGNFHPHFFDYPGLVLYLQLVVACIRFITGAVSGRWFSLDAAPGEEFYLWARGVTAIFGVATVALVFVVGMRWGARHALLAAGLMAVMPMHVRESHFVLTDVPLTFFVTLAFLMTLRAHEKGTARAYWWAGVVAGLAAATKYPGAFVLSLPLIAAWMDPAAKPSRLVCTLVTIGGAAAAFLVLNPYVVLDLPAFLDGFAHLSSAYRPNGRAEAEPGWLIYLKHLRLGFGWPAFLLGLGGLVFGIVRAFKGPGHVRWLLLVFFPILYISFISGKGLIFGRYLLPLIPFACIIIANAVVSGVSVLRRFAIPRAVRTALIIGLTVAALLPPGMQAVRFTRNISGRTTQDVAYAWAQRALPRRARVAVEGHALRLPEPRYQPLFVTALTDRTHEQYAAERIEYAVLSSYVYGPAFKRRDARYDAYLGILNRAQLLTVVRPEGELRGPELRIYKLNP